MPGEWKKKERVPKQLPLFNQKEWVMIGFSVFGGIVLAVILLAFGLNVFKPRVKKVAVPTSRVDISTDPSFKSEKGTFGGQQYVVSVQKALDDGARHIRPIVGCRDFLVIDVKFQLTGTSTLQEQLEGLEGVAAVEVYGYEIVIHRHCVSAPEMPQLWDWREIWGEVTFVLRAYFENK